MKLALVPKHVIPASLGQVPEHGRGRDSRGCRRRARSRRRSAGRRDEEVPHHPAGRREPEERGRRRAASRCRCIFFRCSSRIPPWPWTIAFGSPVVPERVEHPERVVERHAARTSSGAPSPAPQDRSQRSASRRPSRSAPGRGSRSTTVCSSGRHRRLRAPRRRRAGRSPCRRSGSRRPRAAPSARSARSGRSRCGRRSPASSSTRSRRSTRSREERGHRLGDVRQVGDDAVARARRPSARRPAAIRADLVAQLAPASSRASGAQLRRVPDRDRVVVRVPRKTCSA